LNWIGSEKNKSKEKRKKGKREKVKKGNRQKDAFGSVLVSLNVHNDTIAAKDVSEAAPQIQSLVKMVTCKKTILVAKTLVGRSLLDRPG
jgi:hypothetical protein